MARKILVVCDYCKLGNHSKCKKSWPRYSKKYSPTVHCVCSHQQVIVNENA